MSKAKAQKGPANIFALKVILALLSLASIFVAIYLL